ncbi:hypothetical protein GYA19_01995 [Candidatus Beckwithbacteria bacterium]|nr:hypothetical protein [Candidatus Beckwithbacteria bacterium]
MKTLNINYQLILNKLKLEALRKSPDNDLLTGYQVLNNKKIKAKLDEETFVYITPRLESELKIDIEVNWNQSTKKITNLKEDIQITFE